MPPQKSLHIVIGGVGNDDKQWLDRAFRKKLTTRDWVVPKGSRAGDDVVIYIPGHGLYATGQICSSPVPRKNWKHRYGAGIANLRAIRPAISLAVVQETIPSLKWANYPRSITTPSKPIADEVRSLIKNRRRKGVGMPRVKFLDGLSLEELRALAIASSSSSSRAKKTSSLYRKRSEAVRRYVLRRAGGTCEACGEVGPFLAGGMPFLEPHHTVRLADKGPDHPSSIIALCPNCHRRAHSSDDKEVFNGRLKRMLKRIENA